MRSLIAHPYLGGQGAKEAIYDGSNGCERSATLWQQ